MEKKGSLPPALQRKNIPHPKEGDDTCITGPAVGPGFLGALQLLWGAQLAHH
ncbi:Hypothetical protein FKW44_019119 [Caligus rogercresseyi]|uniref:Uncharacterized protein n=1 Tax=Caligus rogercresseyi TaxID=217165 RepID=A0A7T8JXY8_CALRO|nr:Hypothetical protein FKW44_019119 [Caligus rogercresseyi]